MLRYPRYIYTTKTLYSDTGELIVEELLLNGKMTMSAIVKKVADRLTETMEGQCLAAALSGSLGSWVLRSLRRLPSCPSCPTDGRTVEHAEVSSAFVRLADTHFVQRCPLAPATDGSDPGPPPPAPTLVINEKDMYLVPKLNLIGKDFASWNYGMP